LLGSNARSIVDYEKMYILEKSMDKTNFVGYCSDPEKAGMETPRQGRPPVPAEEKTENFT